VSLEVAQLPLKLGNLLLRRAELLLRGLKLGGHRRERRVRLSSRDLGRMQPGAEMRDLPRQPREPRRRAVPTGRRGRARGDDEHRSKRKYRSQPSPHVTPRDRRSNLSTRQSVKHRDPFRSGNRIASGHR
jgi:hypothetical protein